MLRRRRRSGSGSTTLAHPDIDLQHGQRVPAAVVVDLHRDVVYPHHLAAVDVDDLLVEQVARDPHHVLVVVVRDELLVVERDAAAEGDGGDLVVPDDQPGVRAAHQETVDAGRVNERNDSGVFDSPDAFALKIEHRHRDEFCKVQKGFRHRNRPGARQLERELGLPSTLALICALHGFDRRQFQYGASRRKAATKKWWLNAFAPANRSWSPYLSDGVFRPRWTVRLLLSSVGTSLLRSAYPLECKIRRAVCDWTVASELHRMGQEHLCRHQPVREPINLFAKPAEGTSTLKRSSRSTRGNVLPRNRAAQARRRRRARINGKREKIATGSARRSKKRLATNEHE
jgi:hypothetical protein